MNSRGNGRTMVSQRDSVSGSSFTSKQWVDSCNEEWIDTHTTKQTISDLLSLVKSQMEKITELEEDIEMCELNFSR